MTPLAIGRDVTVDEVAQYGYKHGQCGGCTAGFINKAVGRRASRQDDGSIKEDYAMQRMLCPLAHDRFLRRMDRRLAALETGRVHWRLGLEPENYWFTMFHVADLLAWDETQAWDAKHIDKSVYPWVLREPTFDREA